MENRPNVVVVMARCSHSRQYYGIRFEESNVVDPNPGFRFGFKPKRYWVGDWAFEIDEGSGKKEGYDKSEIRGFISMGSAYPGCPHCKGASIFKCSCGKVACWDGRSDIVTCPYCGITAGIVGQFESLSVGKDR